MTQAQRTAITSPADALLVYQTDASKGFYFYNTSTSTWTLLASNDAWSTAGNTGINSGKTFLGTTDLTSLRFRTNNLERFVIDSLGNFGLGTTTPANKLQVSATTDPLSLLGVQTGSSADSILTITGGVVRKLASTSLATSSTNAWARTGNSNSLYTNFLGTVDNKSFRIRTYNTQRIIIDSLGNVGIGANPEFNTDEPEKLLVVDDAGSTSNLIGAYSSKNGYVQIGVQNLSPGNFASSDIVATADNGTNTSNYIDMGINSSGYANNASNILNRPNVGYLYTNATADFFIGNGAPNQGLVLFTNNGAAGNLTANGFEAMRIDGNGNVGIGGTSRNNNGVVTTNPEKLVVSGNIAPRTSGGGNLGTATYRWNTVNTTNGITSSSDRRLKKNIKNLNYGLKEVLAMKPVSYNWKDAALKANKIGLIAQDVKKLVPEVVSGDETKETLGMNYAELVPVLINAIKEQQKQIDELKQIVKKLQK
jgi:hypothetical protein